MATDYKAKLEQFFNMVPWSAAATQYNNKTGAEYHGEVPSGSPIIQVQNKDDLDKIKNVVNAVKGAAPIVNNPLFETMTGLTHKKLFESWQGGGILTSCNGFVMKAGDAAGVKGLGGFYMEETLRKMGKSHCWITPDSGEKPQWGDVFESRSANIGFQNLHVGISLSVEGDTWLTIEGGQGGRGLGYDRVARVKKKYKTDHLLGWVDMRLFSSDAPPMPEWLVGAWMIFSGTNKYIYTFGRHGEVCQKPYQPTVIAANLPNLDTGKLWTISGDTVKVKWDREGGEETFTYDRWNSCPALIEKMSGVAADRSKMNGIRF